mmetsp:Transcript_177799/g.570151  ORF Transcript_177799/g.570151 Transcript_177799/m.570151 type:complete len:342 (+) Transcript_177799:615-1640(+)
MGSAEKECLKGNTFNCWTPSHRADSKSNSRGYRNGQSSPWLCSGYDNTCRCVSSGCRNSAPARRPIQVATPPTPLRTSMAAVKSMSPKSSFGSPRKSRIGTSRARPVSGPAAATGDWPTASGLELSSGEKGACSSLLPADVRAPRRGLASTSCTSRCGNSTNCFRARGRGCSATMCVPSSPPTLPTWRPRSIFTRSRLVAPCTAPATQTSKEAPHVNVRLFSANISGSTKPASWARTQAASHFSAKGGPCSCRCRARRTVLRLSAAIALKSGSVKDGGSCMPNFSMQIFCTNSAPLPTSSPSCVQTSGPPNSSLKPWKSYCRKTLRIKSFQASGCFISYWK